jgi:hypothetical protein
MMYHTLCCCRSPAAPFSTCSKVCTRGAIVEWGWRVTRSVEAPGLQAWLPSKGGWAQCRCVGPKVAGMHLAATTGNYTTALPATVALWLAILQHGSLRSATQFAIQRGLRKTGSCPTAHLHLEALDIKLHDLSCAARKPGSGELSPTGVACLCSPGMCHAPTHHHADSAADLSAAVSRIEPSYKTIVPAAAATTIPEERGSSDREPAHLHVLHYQLVQAHQADLPTELLEERRQQTAGVRQPVSSAAQPMKAEPWNNTARKWSAGSGGKRGRQVVLQVGCVCQSNGEKFPPGTLRGCRSLVAFALQGRTLCGRPPGCSPMK